MENVNFNEFDMCALQVSSLQFTINVSPLNKHMHRQKEDYQLIWQESLS